MIVISASYFVIGQNDVDALRYSRTTFGGTARYMAMGGAFGSLGADFSTLSSNPAGIGLYKKSEFSFTPAFYIGNTNSTYNGASSSDSKNNFNLSNVGLVFTNSSGNNNSVLRNWQLAIGMNRTNNFNNRMMIAGPNTENSLIDTYVEDANGVYYSDIEDDPYGYYAYDLNLAWNTWLIDTIEGYNNQYFGTIPPGGGLFQRKDVESWGSMNEFLLALGGNIGDRLYIGGAFAFPFIRYFEKSTYSEIDQEDNIEDFRSMLLYEELKTHGSGFNMKFGLIIRATNWLRIGGAIHSPTWFYSMKDNWYSEMGSEFDNNDYYSSSSPFGTYDYDLETPWRATGSVSLVLWRFALISADYEYVDYSQSKLRGPRYDFYNENTAIRNKYTEAHNIRLGSEFRFGHFALRGGFGYYGSPFAENETGDRINDGEKLYYTGGLGFRYDNFFLDLAYVRSVSYEDYYLYGTESISVNPVKNELITNNILLTLGFRY